MTTIKENEIELVRKEICDLEIRFVDMFNEYFSNLESLQLPIKESILTSLVTMEDRYLRLVYYYSLYCSFGNQFLYSLDGFYYAVEKSIGIPDPRRLRSKFALKTNDTIRFEQDNTDGRLDLVYAKLRDIGYVGTGRL